MVDEYKKAVQAQRQKTAYMAVGAAVVIHVLFIISKWVAIAAGLAGVGVMLYSLYAATSGNRISMGVAFVLAEGQVEELAAQARQCSSKLVARILWGCARSCVRQGTSMPLASAGRRLRRRLQQRTKS